MAFSQQDPAWAGIKLGTSNYTIGNGGCYITAFCNVLAQYGININPAQMNAKLLAEGRYTGDGGDVSGQTLSQMYPEIQYVQGYNWSNTENIGLDVLKINGKAGYEGIVGLDYQLDVAGVQTHFCRLRGVDDQGFVVIDDSLGGGRVRVQDRYGNQNLSVCYLDLYYKAPVVQLSELDLAKVQIEELKAQLTVSNNHIAGLNKMVADLQTALTNEQNKPPKEVIKEVEKIVEKIVVQTEIVEVEKPLTLQRVIEFIKELISKVLNRSK